MGDRFRIPGVGCAGGVMDKGSELLIGQLSSNSSCARYNHLRTITLGDGKNIPLLPSCGLISKNCITKLLLRKKNSYNLDIFFLALNNLKTVDKA